MDKTVKLPAEQINEVCDIMADVICVLLLENVYQDPDIKNIIDKLASSRLDLRKFVAD